MMVCVFDWCIDLGSDTAQRGHSAIDCPAMLASAFWKIDYRPQCVAVKHNPTLYFNQIWTSSRLMWGSPLFSQLCPHWLLVLTLQRAQVPKSWLKRRFSLCHAFCIIITNFIPPWARLHLLPDKFAPGAQEMPRRATQPFPELPLS